MSVSPATAPSGAVRDAIDLRRLPWVRPLVGAYVHDFASVAPLFAGDPRRPDAWRETIARVQGAPHDRGALAALLQAQLERRGAPAEARRAAASLADPAAVAIVTGQQAGLFGGPLYTLLKAATALQLAAQVRTEYGVPAVPVFWVDEEDHDWDEIRSAHVLDADLALKTITLADVDGARTRTVSTLVLDAGIDDAIAELEAALPPSEYTADVLAELRKHYRPGVTMSAAFAGWLDALLGRHGLVVYESADPAAKAIVRDLLVAELEHPGRTVARTRERIADMTRLGHSPQVEPADDGGGLFYVDQSGRQPIKRRDGHYAIGDRTSDTPALVAEARETPGRFSPNVLLRPVVQDCLFPTICYVGGPSEMAYQAELGHVYRDFGIEVPLLYPRATATLVDAAAARFLERHPVPLEALQAQDDSALNKLLESQLPPTVERAFAETSEEIARRAAHLKSEVVAVDATLAGAVDTTIDRMQDSLKTLHHKIISAAKKKDETLRRQFLRTRQLTFPGGEPQERVLNVVFALNRYGLTCADRLVDAIPLDPGSHYVLSL